MRSVCLVLEFTQTLLPRRYSLFDTGWEYFDAGQTRRTLRQATQQVYLPLLRGLLRLGDRHPDRFGFGLHVPGSMLRMISDSEADLTEALRGLTQSGGCELLGGTADQSVVALQSEREWHDQTRAHAETVDAEFGQAARVIAAPGLCYEPATAAWSTDAGRAAAAGMLVGGLHDRLHGGETAKALGAVTVDASANGVAGMPLIVPGLKASADLAASVMPATSVERGSDGPDRSGRTAAEALLSRHREQASDRPAIVVLTLEAHHCVKPGRVRPLAALDWADRLLSVSEVEVVGPTALLDGAGTGGNGPEPLKLAESSTPHAAPSPTASASPSSGTGSPTDTPSPTGMDRSPEPTEEDAHEPNRLERPRHRLLHNEMQRSSLRSLLTMESAARASKHPTLLAAWRRLCGADHFAWMGTLGGDSGPYDSGYDAYINHANILESLRDQLDAETD